MKKVALFSAVAALMAMLLASPALAREVTIMNGCGFTIAGLSLSDTNSSQAQDLLGNDVLKSGEGVRINIAGGDNGWDLIAVAEDGSNVAFENLNLSGVSTVTLRKDGTADLR